MFWEHNLKIRLSGILLALAGIPVLLLALDCQAQQLVSRIDFDDGRKMGAMFTEHLDHYDAQTQQQK